MLTTNKIYNMEAIEFMKQIAGLIIQDEPRLHQDNYITYWESLKGNTLEEEVNQGIKD